jgi:ribose transport system ATP-binding protein
MTELLAVHGVSKSYGPVPVLHDVALSVPSRSIVGIVGENGAGKSTLFNIISGLSKADSGEMRLKGKPYAPTSFAEAFSLGVAACFKSRR